MTRQEAGRRMTVAEAKAYYSFARDPDEWHRQPTCACGDYICQHEALPPHRCGFSSGNRCGCFRYRFDRMGRGATMETTPTPATTNGGNQ